MRSSKLILTERTRIQIGYHQSIQVKSSNLPHVSSLRRRIVASKFWYSRRRQTLLQWLESLESYWESLCEKVSKFSEMKPLSQNHRRWK